MSGICCTSVARFSLFCLRTNGRLGRLCRLCRPWPDRKAWGLSLLPGIRLKQLCRLCRLCRFCRLGLTGIVRDPLCRFCRL